MDEIDIWSAEVYRKVTTQVVAHAWHRVSAETIVKAFEQNGISINPDGSEDSKVKLRFIELAHLLSWEGWETAKDPDILIKEEKDMVIAAEDDEAHQKLWDYIMEDPSQGYNKYPHPPKPKNQVKNKDMYDQGIRVLRSMLKSRGVTRYSKWTKEECAAEL
ncbi:hypothetical protein EJ02DRAFT_425698 [Clathrospora elynae]|uniref:Uncharacterized protein n=1 Tax=Clathrospora elynae TaxID=706981 RepID=A0A6A5SCX3_9PLEO|nr:hypothetical protein EJ02DRAFT_425698 [Clathrospora elynae]